MTNLIDLGSSCAYLHNDHSEEGNKKITNEIKVGLDNLKANKEGIEQFKLLHNIYQKRIITLETKLAHSNVYPVTEVIKKDKHTKKQKFMRFQTGLKCSNAINVCKICF